MRRWLLLVIPLVAAAAVAAPQAPSAPHDVDLKRGTCSGHPSAGTLLAALPVAVPELVLLWPRVRRTLDAPCATVSRLTVIDHMGHIVTASWVLRGKGAPPPPEGFTAWYPSDWEEPADGAAERSGPPRNEMVWLPEGGREDLHVVVAGSPSAPEETLEGVIGFLSAVPLKAPLAEEAR